MQHMILYQEQKLIHTPTKAKSRTKIFNHLHDSLYNPFDSLDFIHLLISSNPLVTLGWSYRTCMYSSWCLCWLLNRVSNLSWAA